MTKIVKLKSSLALFTILIISIFTYFTTPTQADWNYITLSPYYLLPGQSMTVHGAGYSSGESVTISVAGLNQTTTVNSSGNFYSSGFTIPFSAVGSHQTVTVSGSLGHSNTADLGVGGFYPHATPSTYYATQGGVIQFSGNHFAENEAVTVASEGSILGTATTNGSGNFTTQNFAIPYRPGDKTYSFRGQNSGSTDSVTIHISGTAGVLVLDRYYGMSGQNISLRGQFFGSNEQVNIRMGGRDLGQTQTNSIGEFTMHSSIPNFPASSKQIVEARGALSGQTAQAEFTMAWNNNGNAANSNSGITVSTVSTDLPKNIIASGAAFSVIPKLISTGGDAQNVQVQVSLLKPDSSVGAQQTFANQTLLQNVPTNFPLLGPASLMPNSYTISTTVTNPDSSILASFPNLGIVVVQ